MAMPPRDAQGRTLPHDDPTIEDDDGLIRYINPMWAVRDQDGNVRPSSAAFQVSSGHNEGVSIDLERLLLSDGLTPLSRIPTGTFGAVRLLAGAMRKLALSVGTDPQPDNPYHGQIWGQIGKSQRKKISGLAEWLREPDNV